MGIVGFCYGGGVANAAAVAYPELAAAVPFYGRQPDAADVAKIKAPLLIHYAGLDERVNAGWPAYEAALKAAGTRYEAFIYDGVNHGFHNDSRRAMTRRRRTWPGIARLRFCGPIWASAARSASCQRRRISRAGCPGGFRDCRRCAAVCTSDARRASGGVRVPIGAPGG